MIVLQEESINNFHKIYLCMQKQFPMYELKTEEEFLQLLHTQKYKCFSICNCGQKVGYTIVYFNDKSGFIWIDYLEIYEEFQSKGFGNLTLKAIIEKFYEYNRIYVEVEKPQKEDANTIRRIGFYQRFGFKKLDWNYFYPHKKGLYAMDLYCLPIHNTKMPEQELFKKDIKMTLSCLHGSLLSCREILTKFV